MVEPDKQGKERAREEAPPKKNPTFSHKGLAILIVALLMEAVIAAFLARAVGGTPPKQEDLPQQNKTRMPLIKKVYVDDLEGPTFSVPIAPNVYQAVQIRWIRIEIDPDLDEENTNNLKQSIKNLSYEIRQALQDIVLAEGHENLTVPQKRQRLQNKLRQEIIRMVGVTEKEIRGVIYETVQISN